MTIKPWQDIEKLAVKHEAFGFGRVDAKGYTTHGFDPDGLCDFVNELRALCKKDLTDLVKKVHSAKGRYHSQLAMCDLYDACGLPNERPTT